MISRNNQPSDGWALAVGLVERWIATGERVDALLERLAPETPPPERARAQQLLFGVVRWHSRIEAALDGLMSRPPRTKVRAVLLIAGFELLEGDESKRAPIVHHAVEKAKSVASEKEARLVNAVARKLAERIAAGRGTGDASAGSLASRWAHPEWLVGRWLGQFGAEATGKLLEWNQTPGVVHARWRRVDQQPPAALKESRWPGFVEVASGGWDEVRKLAADGSLYVQDPSTRLCVELLAPQSGETILDAGAAPGGKSLAIADAMGSGRLVAMDMPGRDGEPDARFRRLQENLTRVPRTVEVALMPGDLKRAGAAYFEKHNLPGTFDAVLLDAPCTNTGVMRHRVDVKWRLQEGDFAKHARQQFDLLRSAGRLVRPGGRLVYSTCSIDSEENESVAKRFTGELRGWTLERHVLAFPWVDAHDGAAAFLFRRSG